MSGDKDDEFFGNGFPFFGGFGRYGRDFEKEMDEISKFMEEMLKASQLGFPPHKNFGSSTPVDIPEGFPPVNIPGGSTPLNPRDQMLKGDDDDNKTSMRGSKEQSPISGKGRQPFSVTMPSDDRLSPLSDGQPFFTRRMKGVHVVRRDDGSEERTETVEQDGQICKTITITDPQGKSTSTTHCERSDGTRNFLPSGPFLMAPGSGMNQGTPNTDMPKIDVPSVNSGLNKEDASFFSKLFGGFWNKPKS